MLASDLPEHWRATAETLRQYGADAAASAVQRCADELGDALAAWHADVLTMADAERESGYSAHHLRRLIREGEIPNAGIDGTYAIRRADLPRKVSRPTAVPNFQLLRGAHHGET